MILECECNENQKDIDCQWSGIIASIIERFSYFIYYGNTLKIILLMKCIENKFTA